MIFRGPLRSILFFIPNDNLPMNNKETVRGGDSGLSCIAVYNF